MRLTGVIDRSMDNFLSLRGFAPMIQLSNISESIPDVQRDLILEHSGEMERFLESGEFTFFPEVILCVDLEANKATLTAINNFKEAISSKTKLSKAKVGNLTISTSIYERMSTQDVRNKDKIQSAYFDFDEEKIVKFLRIDGNHRLSAVNENSRYKNKDIPFCIIFFNSKEETDKVCRALFHNINTKQVPLKSEENLKVIIESSNVFSDETLLNDASFGLHYLCTRKLCKRDILVNYPEVNKLIGRNQYTYFVEVFKELFNLSIIPKSCEDAVEIVIKSITDINTALIESKISSVTSNIAVLGAMTIYKLQNNTSKYKSFISWVRRNNIGLVKNLHIGDVMSIFDSVYKNIPKQVFLARWYPDNKHGLFEKAQHRLTAIRDIVENDFGLKLIDIGTKEGSTFDIRTSIFDGIDDSCLFIADLTGVRHNVMVEVGYALSSIGQDKMIFYFSKTKEYTEPPFDLKGFKYELISEAAAMKDAISKHISNILVESESGGV